MKTPRLILSALLVFSLQLVRHEPVHAQSTVTNTSEGIGGEIDAKRREPTVSITTVVETNNVKLLVDAYVAEPDFQKYPIQFDFYINRHFYTSQIRSKELPGPIGIDISPSTATPPFNYTVIARTLHPNRVFTTVVNGAAFTSNLSATLDCTLTTGADSENSVVYISNDVSPTQTGNSSVAINFEADSTPEDHNVKASANITISGESATASLSLEEDELAARTVTLSGDATTENDKLTDLSLSSEDGSVTLSCS